ncbi:MULTISPECIES: serine/threonine-protein kinase [Actinomadura]|uniref:non-specific serine/threonine protein kinase n=1 Tax=Actinomadura yumaensis TaxID=111807 RepID=A0ABW2CPF1_9ACTN|nr:serine/threonine-protein kinase [Actinomadura sp. J1-007]MWK35207.1 protein kinase [Actinomadura sp. J1-007]
MSPGLVLNDRYRLLERLATGGMGEVWHAVDEALARDVAVKVLRQELVQDESVQGRFRSEARFAAALRPHGGIAQVYDFGEHDDRAYLVMELVRGEPLAEIMEREGAIAPPAVLDLVEQVAEALSAAHAAGIVHRDVKPANLMVTGDGTVKITDFGIARRLAMASQTQTGMVMGTAHYISPEQASGQEITPVADLYSLGVVAYECLTGEPPFDGDTPVEIALKHVRDAPPDLPGSVPDELCELVADLLEKAPEDRPEDATEVAARARTIRGASGASGASAAPGAPRRNDASRRNGGPGAGGGAGAATRAVRAVPRDGGSGGSGSSGGPGATRSGATRSGATRSGVARSGSVGFGAVRAGATRSGASGAAAVTSRNGAGGPPASLLRRGRDMIIGASRGRRGRGRGFDGGGAPDTLTSGTGDRATGAGQRRTALAYTSVAAGVLIVGAIVAGSMWRGLVPADLVRDEGDRPVPSAPGGAGARATLRSSAPPLHDVVRPGSPAGRSPSGSHRTSTPGSVEASPSQKPTRKPPSRATPTAPKPTPVPTDSATTPSTPSPGPSPTDSGGLGSEDKV